MDRTVTTEVMDKFNDDIQFAIALAEWKGDQATALGLAQIKLFVNRQFHRAQQDKCQKTAATTSI